MTARAHGVVEVESFAGHLEVIGWGREEVAVTGTVGDGVRGVELHSDGERTRLAVVLPDAADGPQAGAEARLEVRLPAASELTVRTASASVRVDGADGRLTVETVDGGVEVAGAPRELDCRTVSGPVVLAASARIAAVRTVSGAVRVEGAVEELAVETVTGDVDLRAPVPLEARLTTVAGRIHARPELAPVARLRIYVQSGTAEVELDADVAADVRLSSLRGTLETAFGPDAGPPITAEPPAGRELRFRTVDGEAGDPVATVEVGSMSGTIRIARRGP